MPGIGAAFLSLGYGSEYEFRNGTGCPVPCLLAWVASFITLYQVRF